MELTCLTAYVYAHIRKQLVLGNPLIPKSQGSAADLKLN